MTVSLRVRGALTEPRTPAPRDRPAASRSLRARERRLDGRRHAVAVAGTQALAWLVAGNAVGLLLAALLVWPDLGALLGPLTYGRWASVHLDAQLYGWCALPLVALLLHAYLPRRGWGRAASVALTAWSASLVYGSLDWLSGHSSGKLFLEWTGGGRAFYCASLLLLELVLVGGWRSRCRELATRPPARRPFGRAGAAARSTLLAVLFAVPAVLYWASSPRVYPAFNPDSGGATGTSLLGSSLLVVLVLMLVPELAELERRRSAPRWGHAVLAGHFLLFALVGHGQRSHHEPMQVLALASLAIWPPLLAILYRRYRWPRGSGPWLKALLGWSLLLVATAVVTFLPGDLERLRFTNALVAHAHLAMAGVVTSFSATVLLAVAGDGGLSEALGRRWPFRLWHGGCLLFVLSMTALGLLEAAQPGRLFVSDATSTALYGVRLLAGLSMLAAAWWWWRRAAASRPGAGPA